MAICKFLLCHVPTYNVCLISGNPDLHAANKEGENYDPSLQSVQTLTRRSSSSRSISLQLEAAAAAVSVWCLATSVQNEVITETYVMVSDHTNHFECTQDNHVDDNVGYNKYRMMCGMERHTQQ
jgi:hypothetical protein